MAPYTIHLLAPSSASNVELKQALQSMTPKPLTIAHALDWFSKSHLSSTLSNDTAVKLFTIVPGKSTQLPESIEPLVESGFFVTVELADDWTHNYAARNKEFLAVEADDTSPFPDVASSPPDPEEHLEFPLTDSLRALISRLSREYNGPVSMLNLLAFYPGKQPMYQKYTEGFQEVIGPKYGAYPRVIGSVLDHEDRAEGSDCLWEFMGLIHYPNVASFGRMLDGETYKELDRTWKRGVVKENPLMCLVEIDMEG